MKLDYANKIALQQNVHNIEYINFFIKSKLERFCRTKGLIAVLLVEFYALWASREYNTAKLKLSLLIFIESKLEHEKYEISKKEIGGKCIIFLTK